MKSIKTNVLFILFLFSGLFLIGLDKVEANVLSDDGYSIQCLYSDGGLYKMTKSIGQDNDYFISRSTVNLSTTADTSNISMSSYNFVNNPAKDDNSMLKCYENIGNAIYTYKDDNGYDVSMSYYKFGDGNVKFEGDDFTRNSQDKNFWQWIFNYNSKNANIAINSSKNYSLLSEQIILNSKAAEPNKSIFYVQKATQAAGTDKFIEIMVYDNVVLLRSDNLTTVVDADSSILASLRNANVSKSNNSGVVSVNVDSSIKNICINNPEAQAQSGSDGVVVYEYNEKQYKVTTGSCSSGNQYTITNDSVELSGVDNRSLCEDIMPETALVLRDIIKYAQILIPIFLIVLTGLDIGKIVFSGNLDEEIPKQKKKIIFRAIAAVVFFFLPLIVNLTVRLLNSSGDENSKSIQQIQCLFE